MERLNCRILEILLVNALTHHKLHDFPSQGVVAWAKVPKLLTVVPFTLSFIGQLALNFH